MRPELQKSFDEARLRLKMLAGCAAGDDVVDAAAKRYCIEMGEIARQHEKERRYNRARD